MNDGIRETNLSGDRSTHRQTAQDRLARRVAALKEKLGPSFRVVQSCPETYKPLLTKALTNEASPRESIKAHCQQCVGWEEVKTRVGDCRSLACPLWHHRPYQGTENDDENA